MNQGEAVRLLIARGAALNVADKGHSTPVQHCAMYGLPETLEILLQAGADPEYCDPKDINDHPPLHMACNRQQPETVQLLVRHGADINRRCDSGYTALMHLGDQDVEIARFLVGQGADVNALNAFGKGMDEKLREAVRRI